MGRTGKRSATAMEAPVVVASNRGPITYVRDHRGKLEPQKGAGGLVTAMSGVFFHDDATWVAAATSKHEVEIARAGRAIGAGSSQRVRFVNIRPATYERYYNGFSNKVLWFAHHYLWDVARSPTFGRETRQAWDAYVEANHAFARELAKEAPRDPVFLIQDYQLSLVPSMLRELAPQARILHFSHTPFAGPEYLRILPHPMREGLLRGMAGADVIGFQSRIWAENFILSARYASGMRVDLRSATVTSGDHRAHVRVFPVAVNPHALRDAEASPRVAEARAEVDELRGDRKLLLRVDRLEPSKNILRGFEAFGEFLRRNSAWRERVVFLALFSPSRDTLPEYQTYGDECLTVAAKINEEYGTMDWTPIDVRVQEDFLFAVGAYSSYDVLLVNSVYDGMNLVAMEGPLVNRRRGALVLSRNAGAWERIGRHAVGVNPFDLDETADALRTALEMPGEERQRRARGLQRAVLAHTPESWLAAQLEAIDTVRRRGRSERPEEGEGAFHAFDRKVSDRG
jgi:trehalose 6-phosphate synthase